MQLHNEKWMQGELIRATDSEILLSPEVFEEATVPFVKIDSLWIEHGNRMQRGILWGMGIGAAVGAVVTFALSPFLFNSIPQYEYAAPGGVVGLAIGCGIGAWVGATTPGWKKLYP